MNSSRLPLENNGRSGEYHKNKVKSIWILILLGVILAAAVLLSLWAGSYDTPVTELLRGIANKANNTRSSVCGWCAMCGFPAFAQR